MICILSQGLEFPLQLSLRFPCPRIGIQDTLQVHPSTSRTGVLGRLAIAFDFMQPALLASFPSSGLGWHGVFSEPCRLGPVMVAASGFIKG